MQANEKDLEASGCRIRLCAADSCLDQMGDRMHLPTSAVIPREISLDCRDVANPSPTMRLVKVLRVCANLFGGASGLTLYDFCGALTFVFCCGCLRRQKKGLRPDSDSEPDTSVRQLQLPLLKTGAGLLFHWQRTLVSILRLETQ